MRAADLVKLTPEERADQHRALQELITVARAMSKDSQESAAYCGTLEGVVLELEDTAQALAQASLVLCREELAS